MRKIKVLNIVDEFHPDAGYENNVLSKFMVKLGYDYDILTTHFIKQGNYLDFLGTDNIEEKDKLFTEETGVHIFRERIKKRYSGRALWNMKRTIARIDTINPDILFFCGNDSLIFIRYLWKFRRQIVRGNFKYKIICDSHMLDMASTNKFKKLFYAFYKKMITPIIIKSGIIVIRLQDDLFVNKRFGIPLKQSPFISFGTDTLLFKPSNDKAKSKKQIGISPETNSFLIIYAGKINESKGGDLLANALKERINSKKRIAFLIVANANTSFEQKVLDTLKESENNIVFHNAVSYKELYKYYQAADLAIFPKQCSLSFFDLQSCGVPVLLEDNNINRQRVSYGNGFLFNGTVCDLHKQIEIICNKDSLGEYEKNSIRFIQNNYDYEKISHRYDEIFKSLVEKCVGEEK